MSNCLVFAHTHLAILAINPLANPIEPLDPHRLLQALAKDIQLPCLL
jgi:hypothetical protein